MALQQFGIRHVPHEDSRLYDDSGIIRHPLQRDIAPSQHHGVYGRALALINSVIPNRPIVAPTGPPLIVIGNLPGGYLNERIR